MVVFLSIKIISCFYRTPGIADMDWTTSKGNIFPYFSYGAAVSEVEIDCLTGDHQVYDLIYLLHHCFCQ